MAQLFESYAGSDDTTTNINGVNWFTMTFTPSASHTITSVFITFYKEGSPGTITVSIRATDGAGKPTGSDLASGTTNGNTLPNDPSREKREITLGAGTPLSASTKYAVVVRALSGDSLNQVHPSLDNTSPSYAGGSFGTSADSGATWTMNTGIDVNFEEWGELSGQFMSLNKNYW